LLDAGDESFGLEAQVVVGETAVSLRFQAPGRSATLPRARFPFWTKQHPHKAVFGRTARRARPWRSVWPISVTASFLCGWIGVEGRSRQVLLGLNARLERHNGGAAGRDHPQVPDSRFRPRPFRSVFLSATGVNASAGSSGVISRPRRATTASA